jgi:hypothetical protein
MADAGRRTRPYRAEAWESDVRDMQPTSAGRSGS